MSLMPVEDEAAGLRAYEQARAFESFRKNGFSRVTISAFIEVVVGLVALATHHFGLTGLCFMAAAASGTLAWRHDQWLQERHAKNLRLLTKLEARYGTEVPWLKVERHLEALAQLERELAAERALPEAGEIK